MTVEVLALDFPALEDPVHFLTERLQALEAAGAIDQDAELSEDGGRAFGLFEGPIPGIDWGAARAERWSVRPHSPWAEASAKPPVSIASGGAFGSGHHPTTSMMLAALAALEPQGRILDVGTGTGVLALSALKGGAVGAVATDILEAALESARANAKRNGMADRIELGRDFTLFEGPFDLILANIRARPLVEMAPELRSRLSDRGRLLISGLRFHEDRAVCRALGLEPIQARLCRGWWQLHFEGGSPRGLDDGDNRDQRQGPA